MGITICSTWHYQITLVPANVPKSRVLNYCTFFRKQKDKDTEPSASMNQSETSIDNELTTLSSLTTSAPDLADTSSQDSQEADIEVCNIHVHDM